jgi:hypothetical protein
LTGHDMRVRSCRSHSAGIRSRAVIKLSSAM